MRTVWCILNWSAIPLFSLNLLCIYLFTYYEFNIFFCYGFPRMYDTFLETYITTIDVKHFRKYLNFLENFHIVKIQNQPIKIYFSSASRKIVLITCYLVELKYIKMNINIFKSSELIIFNSVCRITKCRTWCKTKKL